jgi:hypothetical protein
LQDSQIVVTKNAQIRYSPQAKRKNIMAAKVGKPNTAQQKPVSQYEETKREGYAGGNRKAEEVRESGPGKVQAARKAHHGKSTNADGSSFATPLRKGKTSGGDGGL